MVLDEFARKDWPGESKALEQHFQDNRLPAPELKTFSWCGMPTTYSRKKSW